jgi:hypothetical protein
MLTRPHQRPPSSSTSGHKSHLLHVHSTAQHSQKKLKSHLIKSRYKSLQRHATQKQQSPPPKKTETLNTQKRPSKCGASSDIPPQSSREPPDWASGSPLVAKNGNLPPPIAQNRQKPNFSRLQATRNRRKLVQNRKSELPIPSNPAIERLPSPKRSV